MLVVAGLRGDTYLSSGVHCSKSYQTWNRLLFPNQFESWKCGNILTCVKWMEWAFPRDHVQYTDSYLHMLIRAVSFTCSNNQILVHVYNLCTFGFKFKFNFFLGNRSLSIQWW